MARRFSFAGRIGALFVLTLVVMAFVAAAASTLPLAGWQVFLLVLLLGLPLGLWSIGRFLAPVNRLLASLSDGIRSFRDRDFSVRINARRSDELGDVARLYNEVGELLRQERTQARERELLLQSTLDESPVGIVLVGPTGRVVFSNREARRLLVGGGRLDGEPLEQILDGCPPEMRQLARAGVDGLFSFEADSESETYQLARRSFHLNRRRHQLLLLRRLTDELGRQEAEIWKKVIRILSHEINNSLAPVSSLVHSAGLALRDPERRRRAGDILSSVRDRIDHLAEFLDGYARFARLPRPQPEDVAWRPFLDEVARLYPFELDGGQPSRPGWFDAGQLQQVLINLLKNAAEASDGEPDVRLRVSETADGVVLQVLDRGRGMDDEVLRRAVLPFYSTKRHGSGLGLALCREIVEAHGGRLSIRGRRGGGTVVSCWLPARAG